jgi:hypothetical protein
MKIKRSELSNLRMTAGNEKKYDKVVIDGKVKEWVGIGWVTLRDASDKDRTRYPVVED